MSKRKVTRIAAGGWERLPGDVLGKSRKLDDGEMTQLLVAMTDIDQADLRETAYGNLTGIQEDMTKAGSATFVASAFGLLVYEGALSGFSTGGMQLDKLSFAHAALVAMSASTLWFCMLHTRASYISSWFAALSKLSTPSQRAILLLRYPAAFFYFQYMPVTRGYPPNVYPKRDSYLQLLPVALLFLTAIAVSIGTLALWVAVAVRVWQSAYPSPVASKATVVGCALTLVLGWIAPRFGVMKRTYVHYGLSDLLCRIDGDRKARAFQRIARAQPTMPDPAPDPDA